MVITEKTCLSDYWQGEILNVSNREEEMKTHEKSRMGISPPLPAGNTESRFLHACITIPAQLPGFSESPIP
jgi:hypothetical protein